MITGIAVIDAAFGIVFVDVLDASAAAIGIGAVVTIGIAVIDAAFGIVVVGTANLLLLFYAAVICIVAAIVAGLGAVICIVVVGYAVIAFVVVAVAIVYCG